MGPFVYLYVALVGFFAAAALVHAILWCLARRETLLVIFGADCLARAMISAALVGVATAATPAEAQTALRFRVAFAVLGTITSLWSLSLVSGVRARWFVRPVTVILGLIFVIHVFVMPLTATVLAIDQTVLPWGEIISQPRLGPSGWWFGPIYLLAAATQVFGLVGGARLRTRDRLAGALVMAAACGILLVLATDILRYLGIMSAPFIGVLPQVFWVGAIAVLIARGHRRTQQELAQRQKLAAVGQLAGGVAHDFNNLLTVINGNSELLLSMASKDAPKSAMLRSIHDAGKLAASLTSRLLTFSRRQVIAPRVLDLNAVVVETEKLLDRIIEEDICLETRLHPDLAHVRADPGQLGQVIMNLAVNARDAMPLGGRLVIETANVGIDEAAAALQLAAVPGPYVMLAVTDTGCGMTAEVRSRIFEPFFTTKGPGQGTGLGLATVNAVAEECGGFLAVESEPGRGSTFRLYLPALARSARAELPDADAGELPRGTETILLVEDSLAVRELTRQMLQRSGYAVIDVPGGAEAIALVGRHEGPLDLLVTDVVMPEMGGRQLAERMAVLRPGLRVLFLSGYTGDAVARQGIQEADAFLQKPFTTAALAHKVRQTLDAAAASLSR